MATNYYDNYQQSTIFSDDAVRLHLTSGGGAVSTTVPGTAGQDQFQAIFTYASDSNVIVGYNTVPTIPGADSAETTQVMEYKPEKRMVKAGDVLRFITPDTTAYCGVSFRKVPA